MEGSKKIIIIRKKNESIFALVQKYTMTNIIVC